MKIISSEAVCNGHPDKICDQIADAILVACLKDDPESHVACEVCCTTGTVILMGEITTNSVVNYKQIARDVLKLIGYTSPEYGIDSETCAIIDLIDKQSSEINNAVNVSFECRVIAEGSDVSKYDLQGAGDQGIMFGYACKETEELMPLSLALSHKLARRIEDVRVKGIFPELRPDGKTQVSVAYNDDGTISHIDTILISVQHDENITLEEIKSKVYSTIIHPVIYGTSYLDYVNKEIKIIINPSGKFTIGGPHGDTGLTGRKLAVDTYGGHAKFGGGAMCGKDPSKVDRSAAYMVRYIAKHIVASGLAKVCEVQISYGIGIANPISVWVDTKFTGIIPDEEIIAKVKSIFDMRPLAIIDQLGLKYYDYTKVSGACQFGNHNCPWEKIDENICTRLAITIREF